MLRFGCYSCFIVQVGVLRLCVIESVNRGCRGLMVSNCFVCVLLEICAGLIGIGECDGGDWMWIC